MAPAQNMKQIDPLAVLLDVLDAPNVAPSIRTDPAIPDQATNATHPAPDPRPTAASEGSTVPPVPPVDTTFRAAVDNAPPLGKGTSVASRVARGLAGFLLAVCIGIASFVWQSPYGDAARQKITDVTQQVVSFAQQVMPMSSPPAENPVVAAQQNPPADQAASTATTSAQPAPGAQPSPAAQSVPPAQAAPEAPASTAVALSPETTQLLQSMAHDLATVQQGIEQLKASQEQLARDNAKLAEQLKLNQERMVRILAKTAEARAVEARVSEQNLRPKPAAYPSRPIAYPAREPVPALPPPQTIVPQAGTQPQALDPESSSAPRPPMPVH